MVKASSQIEKELGLLQQRTEDMANALDPLYSDYLKALGEASKQQLIAAVYHLCTQAYPDKFLSLSWQQRNTLQKSLQLLATQIHTQLSEQREQVKKNSRKPQRNNGLAFLQKLLAARASGAIIHTKEGSSDDLLDKLSEIARFDSSPNGESSDGESKGDSDTQTNDSDSLEHINDWQNDVPAAEEEDELSVADFESFSLDMDDDLARTAKADNELGNTFNNGLDNEGTDEDESDSEALDFEVEVPAAEQRLTLSEEDDLLGALEALARRSSEDEKEKTDEDAPLSPFHLVKQQMLMEQAIRDVFKTVSEEANSLLQKADVMPNFPKALMAAAADTRGAGEPLNAVPNVVKVSVRVMHGAANFDLGEEDETGEDRESSGRNRMRKLGPRRPSDGSEQNGKDISRERYRENNQEEHRRSDFRRAQGDRDNRYRNSRRRDSREPHREERSGYRPEGPPRNILPPDAIEIEAFPEFAVINLQLSEVEFTDPRVSVWRARLRKELANLKQLGVRYRKTQRSLEIAQAEDAWRASWTSQEES